MSSFFGELKRRRVYRVALGYGIFASFMIQVGGTILPVFEAPQWMQQVFIVLVATGFPVALVFAWLYDVTTEGIKRTSDGFDLHASSKRQLFIVILVGTLIAAVALYGYWLWHPWRNFSRTQDENAGLNPRKSIAVLPFENLSPDNAGTFFADSIQDQILTNLAKVSDLRVISHTSAKLIGNARLRFLWVPKGRSSMGTTPEVSAI